ncbi:zinc finger BED domain-containing protein DAYSLEEPER-like isoform X2 [Triticum aestivum]|uniref:zinc finger BED domain-containing protein DAYSLEEPER-like isoform X2 n=1 Tax=Triticum aestivum TaxID=4565 RepID=UPI001D034F50|nr:zinc finger BED domain-containing protein DAYSLEEPER-like isoform X2 [Triticum aestivum]
MDERRRPAPSATATSMESRKKRVASDCASRDSPSTAAQPDPLLLSQAQKRARVDPTMSDVDDARSAVDGDIEEWVEVNEGYEEVDEADAYDMDDEMSDPSLGLGDKGNDVQAVVLVNNEKTKRVIRKKATVNVGNNVKVRKSRVKRAPCWQHFKEVKAVCKKKPGAVVTKAKCLHCCNLFAYTPGGPTTSLNRHVDVCADYLNKKGRQQRQGTINLDPEKPGASLIVNHEYDHAQVVKIIAKMIIVHEYPFRMVEHAWFNILMRYMNASYKFIGRKKIRAECMKVYLSEKEILKKQLRSIESISLTSDIWTSNQNLSYLAIVAHYIDEDWVMQFRVLNLIELDPPHTGFVIAQAVFECCQEWKNRR